jgi:hypothetical protein
MVCSRFAACASTFGLLITIALLTIAGTAGARAECEVQAGDWHRGLSDATNFRTIGVGPGDRCDKTSYTGFDGWGGIREITAPSVGKLRCGFLTLKSPTGWTYQTYDVVPINDGDTGTPLPVLPSIPCMEQFVIRIHDGGDYVTSALYGVHVGQR